MAKRPAAKSKQHRPSLDERIPRDLVLFVGGFLGMVHETVRNGIAERPFLTTAFLGMMGLPVWLRRDEATHDSEENETT